MGVLRRAGLFAVVGLGIATPVAAGAVRFAAPAGVGASPCAESDPCSLGTAVSGAAAGDEVRLLPGAYLRSATLDVFTDDLTIAGSSPLNPPQITSTVPFLSQFPTTRLTLRDLDVVSDATGNPVVSANNVVAERIRLRAVSGTFQTLSSERLEMRNSVVVTESMGGVGVTARNGNITGSTILANAHPATRAVALDLEYWGAAAGAVTIRNSIVEGGVNDVEVRALAGQVGVIDVNSSAYQTALLGGAGSTTVNAGSGNVGPPTLVDLPGRTDVHQVAGSSTIDAGDSSLVSEGELDMDGVGRWSGAAPDIGADEVTIPAAATTSAATAVGQREATLNGRVTPNGPAGTAWFEWGTTGSYGQRTPDVSLPVGAWARNLSAPLTGLAPATTYHARVVIETPLGRVNGADVQFTTTAAVPPPVLPNPAPALGRISLASTRVRTDRRLGMRFPLSERSRLTVTIYRRVPGRLVGTNCKVTAKVGRACLKPVKRTALTFTQAPGSPASYRLPARPGGKALSPGLYEVRVIARDLVTGSASALRTARFSVVR